MYLIESLRKCKFVLNLNKIEFLLVISEHMILFPDDSVIMLFQNIYETLLCFHLNERNLQSRLDRSLRDIICKLLTRHNHFRDGSTQSGTLCAIFNLIERVKSENVVDVFRAVKDVRDLRMGAVGSEEQFEFCYKVVAAFIESFDLYSNFK